METIMHKLNIQKFLVVDKFINFLIDEYHYLFYFDSIDQRKERYQLLVKQIRINF